MRNDIIKSIVKADLKAFVDSIRSDPEQGVLLAPGIRKVRMAIESKGKGKSGGARVITYNVVTSEVDGVVVLVAIYDKQETSNIKIDVIKEIITEMGHWE